MISICMAYFNRKQQLCKTLESIRESSIKDYELVIVDDGSYEEHSLNIDDLERKTNGNVKLFTVDSKKKTWFNSCIAYNIALSAASGDKIIIQNPETYHLGDILRSVENELHDGKYLTFRTIALNSASTDALYSCTNIEQVNKFMQPIINTTHHIKPGDDPYTGTTIWYNHRTYRPVYYHFVSAITKNNLNSLGGFDERFSDDHSWDDNEILVRIDRLGLKKIIIDDPMAIHLYHPVFFSQSPNHGMKNYSIYHNIILKEHKILAQELNLNNYINYFKQ